VSTRESTVVLRHNKIELALHCLRPDGPGRPLLHLHGLGEQSPAGVPPVLASWPGPVWALDFTGHGRSTIPDGGGYFCEVLMGDVDAALAHLGAVTVYGRGIGGYVGLLIAGARGDDVRGVIVDDGPGLVGGSTEPGTPFVLAQPLSVTGTPDPYALLDLHHDIRPPDYASAFARLAASLSGLDVAVAVTAIVRPPWLAAVMLEPGVRELPLDHALALFAST
jgi:pimeloyl-ACP methyl ester carboxylesterase